MSPIGSTSRRKPTPGVDSMAFWNDVRLPRRVDRMRSSLPSCTFEHCGGQFVHPQVEAEERPLADLGAAAQRKVALVVQREATLVEIGRVGDQHAAVAARDGLVQVEAVRPAHTDRAEPTAVIATTECLCGVFDQHDVVAPGDVAERIEIARRPEHVHGEDGLGLAGDASLDVDAGRG